MDPLTFRMEEEAAFLRSIIDLVRPGYYPEEQLFLQLKEHLPVDSFFSEEELRRLRAINVEKHWQFVALTIGRIKQLFPGSRWREILSHYVALFTLLPGFEFAEEDLRRFRDEPENLFESPDGHTLRRSLRTYSHSVGSDFMFAALAKKGYSYVADITFGNMNQIEEMLKRLRCKSFYTVLSGNIPDQLYWPPRRPTLAEQTVLDSLPRP